MTLATWVKELFEEPVQSTGRTFLISDTHFDHTNIIGYSMRPFPSIDKMNRTIVRNWNTVVKPEDTVYFLGDFAFRGTNIGKWIRRLNGRKVFVKGNHDRMLRHGFSSIVLEYEGEKFLLIHNPNDVRAWDGWVIHGHTHNSDLEHYPLINNAGRRMNVSIEVLGYHPVEIGDLLSLRGDQDIRALY